MLPERKRLPHVIPSWVEEGSAYFITICTGRRGHNQLCRPDVAAGILAAWAFYQNRGDVWIYLLVLMPDHLHAIMSFNRDQGMQKAIREFKKFTARALGISWQRDFFDHRLRDDKCRVEKAHYIRMNPVRAGLCKTPGDWPYVWDNAGSGGDESG